MKPRKILKYSMLAISLISWIFLFIISWGIALCLLGIFWGQYWSQKACEEEIKEYIDKHLEKHNKA
jgi:uncharacterized protein YneF (UPF0154 family)